MFTLGATIVFCLVAQSQEGPHGVGDGPLGRELNYEMWQGRRMVGDKVRSFQLEGPAARAETRGRETAGLACRSETGWSSWKVTSEGLWKR